MNRQEKLLRALLNLNERGLDGVIENDTLYVLVNDSQLELSEFEIDFQVSEWMERQGYN